MSRSILVLEPFGGGSHASFYRGWQRYSRHNFTILELPAVHWKWRSRHASLTLALQANTLWEAGQRFDLVFCSEMLNLPEWRGCARPELQALPAIVYFHENQFSYPVQAGQTRDYHLAYSNLLSAITAEQLWFNSRFHRDEFQSAASAWLRRMPDFKHWDLCERAWANSLVCHPGIRPPNPLPERRPAVIPRIGWVARWEFDKRPDRFRAAIAELQSQGYDFRLILLGQQFARLHPELEHLRELAGPRIDYCGFAQSQEEYWEWLSRIDLVVSTAEHEFFGIGMLEAIAAGAQPLLPRRLAYPELVEGLGADSPTRYLYSSDDELGGKLIEWVRQFHQGWRPDPLPGWSAYEWRELASRYDDLAEKLPSHSA